MSATKALSRKTIGDYLTEYARKGTSDDLLEFGPPPPPINLERMTNPKTPDPKDLTEAKRLYNESVREGKSGVEKAQKALSDRVGEVRRPDRSSLAELLRNRKGELEIDEKFTASLREKNFRELSGIRLDEEDNVLELLKRRGYDATDMNEPANRRLRAVENEITSRKETEVLTGPYLDTYGQESTALFAAEKRLMEGKGYSETAHMNTNTTVASEAMSGSTSGSTGSTNYSGYYQPGETPSSSGLLGSMSQDGAAGVMSSVAFGAAIGGAANYAMGGEFGEGAMMGGIAGGGIKIGARAIQQNQASIENFLQRTALGAESYTEGMSRDTAAGAIQHMSAAPEGAGLMQKGAFNMLKSESPSLGMQSRYMVMGGSALAGVTFTGNRKDKRRGFNAHRGNRI